MTFFDFTKINDEFFHFIKSNEMSDIATLRLKRDNHASFDMDMAITQIECRKRIKKKLPEISKLDGFLYPSVLSTEQCTSEVIAKFHANIIGKIKCVLDMTGGLCIDDFYIARNADSVISLEYNKLTTEISRYNMAKYCDKINIINCDSVEYIKNCTQFFDAVFIDPARRGENNRRLFGISDCDPDIIPLLPFIQKCTNTLYIKASPMIDIKKSLQDIPMVSDVWIISLKNECKELFFRIDFNNYNSNRIHCINFTDENAITDISYNYNNSSSNMAIAEFPQSYLYEPNASIMKANAFYEVSQIYNVSKIAINSHLFTSNSLIDNFPGRCFKILNVYPFKDKALKTALKGITQINISTRNFKLTANQLKQRLKLKDGGDKYLFGTTLSTGEMVIIICEKM